MPLILLEGTALEQEREFDAQSIAAIVFQNHYSSFLMSCII